MNGEELNIEIAKRFPNDPDWNFDTTYFDYDTEILMSKIKSIIREPFLMKSAIAAWETDFEKSVEKTLECNDSHGSFNVKDGTVFYDISFEPDFERSVLTIKIKV